MKKNRTTIISYCYQLHNRIICKLTAINKNVKGRRKSEKFKNYIEIKLSVENRML